MKKKWLIPVVILAVILILAAGALWYFSSHSLSFSTGRCIVTSNGSYMILLDDSPVTMRNCSKNEDLFEGLKTGDEIRILHDGIQETYPGGTGVYSCKLVSEGSIDDIPEDMIASLSPMGWIAVDDSGLTKEIYTGTVISYEPVYEDEGNFLLKLAEDGGFVEEVTITVVADTEIHAIDGIAAGDHIRVECASESSGYREAREVTEYQEVSYEYSFANMTLTLPAGWVYEIEEYDEEEYAFGINFWPEGVSEGKLRLEYWVNEFGVCGTGLEQEEIRLDNGLRAWKGTYDNRTVWDFISIRDLAGSYVFIAEGVDDWWDSYSQQAMEIINSCYLADGMITKNEAIRKAEEALKGEAEVTRASFDFCEGVWTVTAEDGDTTYTVYVSVDGTVQNATAYNPDAGLPRKPVIYLYPEETMQVTVKLDFDGQLTTTYPAYNDGWTVTAHPDGTLADKTGREYYCLFWEGISNAEYDFSTGFVVAGAETEKFLESALAQMGLTDKEANEFIIYWLPQMEGNAYNLISFQQEAYTDSAVLTIDPAPDSVLRIFMAWKPLDEPMEIEPQELLTFERKGFTVVEWGGAFVK